MKSLEKYVDGFLIPIAKDKVSEYREIAQKAGEAVSYTHLTLPTIYSV